MRLLIVLKQRKNLYTFEGTIRELLARGHEVRLAIQERDTARSTPLPAFDSSRFSVVACPPIRTDDWAQVAPLLRSLRDCVRYMRPEFRGAGKLRARVVHKLKQEITIGGDGLRDLPTTVAPDQVAQLDAVLALAEAALPSDRLQDQFLAAHAPDVVLASPVVHFLSAQADLVSAARRRRIPVGMLLFSWDNLSTKGCLHVHPDRMFVWNERQRREAVALHAFPAEHVVVAGAPRFDEFFALGPTTSREEFFGTIGLDPGAATLLYLCSSRFVTDGELPVIRKWLERVRSSGSPALRSANVLVRPHPDVPLLAESVPSTPVRWPSLPKGVASVARPFDDDRAIVLRTAYGIPQSFYDCLFHSVCVVGLNTTAELEAGIVGRPVFTFTTDDERVSGQASTLHFHYLLKEQGGFVVASRDVESHVRELASALERPPDRAGIRAFVGEFLRPHGLDVPVAGVLARAIETAFGAAGAAVGEAPLPISLDAASPQSAVHAPRPGEGAPVQAAAVRVQYDPCSLWVYPTPDLRRSIRKNVFRPDVPVVEWLEQSVEMGDIVYDIGAGIGVYALIGAKRGAVVVAFEGGFAAFSRLCENLLLNGCDGAVLPVAVELSERETLGEIKYHAEHVGFAHHQSRERPWRGRPPAKNGQDVQPACMAQLDAFVERYDLPRPTHLRVDSPKACERILRGALRTLTHPGLRTLLLTIQQGDRARVAGAMTAAGFAERRLDQVRDDVVRVLYARAAS